MENTSIEDGETSLSKSEKGNQKNFDIHECPIYVHHGRTLSLDEIREKSCNPEGKNMGKRKVKRGVSFKNDDISKDEASDNPSFCTEAMDTMKPPLLLQLNSFHSEARSQASQATTNKDRTSISSVRRTPMSSLPLIEDQKDYLPEEYEFKGFKTIDPRTKCCICPPRPSMMNTKGWIAWGFLCVIFWPLSFLPCILSYSYDPYQIPVYDRITKTDDSR